MLNFENVTLETQDRIAIITLNRPKKLNAINADLKRDLVAILNEIENNNDLRVLIIRGAGRAFCAGGDLSAIQNKKGMGRPEDLRFSQTVLKRIVHMDKIVIAAVHGFATGAGCNLALGADLVYAAQGTQFGQSFIKVGLVPDWGGMYLLPLLAGVRKAKEWMLLGETFDAQDALSCGLINGIFDEKKLFEKVLQIAQKLAVCPKTAAHLIKKIVNNFAYEGLQKILDAELEAFTECADSSDFIEGINAFLEKRKPVFG